MTPDEVERIETRLTSIVDRMETKLASIDISLLGMTSEISALKTQIHAPATCGLENKVRDLELQNARNKGIFVTIGFLATTISAIIGGIIVKVWK